MLVMTGEGTTQLTPKGSTSQNNQESAQTSGFHPPLPLLLTVVPDPNRQTLQLLVLLSPKLSIFCLISTFVDVLTLIDEGFRLGYRGDGRV